MTSEIWNPKDYLNYIVKNNLDSIWSSWCNPASGDGGIRVAAYKPLYNDSYAKWLDAGNKPCKKCTGYFVIPDADKQRRIINRWRCNVCSSKKDVLYRDMDKRDPNGRRTSKLYFSDNNTVRFYGNKGRTFYSTLILYDKQILNPSAIYGDASLMKSVTLGIDIDIKNGCITETKNRSELQKAIDHLKIEFLDKIVPKSYNLQSSGNGIYVLLHHKLVSTDVFKTCLLFNELISEMNNDIENEFVKMDALNGASRVFKLMGSIHQQYDLVAIPLPYDVDLTKMNPEQFKLSKFTINDYIDKQTGNLEYYYKRYDMQDSKSLYDFLEKNVALLSTSSPRAMRAKVRGKDVDETKWASQCAEFMKKDAWTLLDLDIPGEVYFRIKDEGLEINLFRVPKEDRDKISKIAKDKIKDMKLI